MFRIGLRGNAHIEVSRIPLNWRAERANSVGVYHNYNKYVFLEVQDDTYSLISYLLGSI